MAAAADYWPHASAPSRDATNLAGGGPRLMLMAAPTPTLGEVALRNLEAAGYGRIRAMKKASEALTTVAALAIAAARSENGFPTQAQYAAYWRQPIRSAQRDWQRFREAFPDRGQPRAIGAPGRVRKQPPPSAAQRPRRRVRSPSRRNRCSAPDERLDYRALKRDRVSGGGLPWISGELPRNSLSQLDNGPGAA